MKDENSEPNADSNISLTAMLIFTMQTVLLFASLPNHEFSRIFRKGLYG